MALVKFAVKEPDNIVALPADRRLVHAMRLAIRTVAGELDFPIAGISLRCGVPAFGFPGLLPLQIRVPWDRAMYEAAFELRGVLCINDMRDHPVFRESSLVAAEPFLRAFAGCPLQENDSTPIGTL